MILGLMADHTFCKDPASTACTTHDGKTGTCRSGICTVGLQECGVVRTALAAPLALLLVSTPAVQSRLELTGLNIRICMNCRKRATLPPTAPRRAGFATPAQMPARLRALPTRALQVMAKPATAKAPPARQGGLCYTC